MKKRKEKLNSNLANKQANNESHETHGLEIKRTIEKRENAKSTLARRKWKISFIAVFSVIALTVITGAILLEPLIRIRGFENLDSSKLTVPNRSITILDANGNDLTEDWLKGQHIVVNIDEVPQHTKDAFITIEDKRFYSHNGIDYLRIMGAVKNDIVNKSYKEGGSTITQQLVKNTHLSNEKTFSRKLQEARIARAVERKYSKDEILEMYFNILYFGNNLYGIGTASKAMFRKSTADLTIAESALLAAIINSPANYSPYTNPEKAIARRNLVLQTMYTQEKIDEEEFLNAKNEKIYVMPVITHKNPFFDWIFSDAAEILHCKERDLYNKNLVVHTHMDADFQEIISVALKSTPLPKDVFAQVLLLDNHNGEILALDGYGNTNFSTLYRSPASTIKPILSYAPALEKRLILPATPIQDNKMSFGGWSPSNYRNVYEGWTSIENSLSNSSNICAIKLLEICTVPYAKSIASRCGIPFEYNDKNLTLALGCMEKGVSLRDITGIYQVFANSGKKIAPSFVQKIEDKNGNVLFNRQTTEKRALHEDTAYFINQMLLECAKSGTAKKLKGIAPYIAAKTGTMGDKNGNTDAYCIAYTPEYTVAVWVGSKDNKHLHQINGGGLCTTIAGEIFKQLPIQNSQPFYKPSSIIQVDIDTHEYHNKHRLMLVEENALPRYRKTIESSKHHYLPKKPRQSSNYITHNTQKAAKSAIFCA
ncbi:MAG: penicillin-binding protein [Firmicutes bacterium]|nr:penicillin-binding protein [Bacillota bacterium]